jgi:hypothetical protein
MRLSPQTSAILRTFAGRRSVSTTDSTRVAPNLQELTASDGLTPIRFPLSATAAQTARVARDEAVHAAVTIRSLLTAAGALIFVVMSTSAFVLTWGLDPAPCALGAADCSGSFQGLSASPSLGDFFYLSLNAIVANMPPDIVARSQTAHAVFAGTFISGVLIITLYLVPALNNVCEQVRPVNANADG